MNKRLLVSIYILCGLSLTAAAQQQGQVVVIKDPRIEVLQQLRAGTSIGISRNTESNNRPVDKSTATRTVQRGFRVQIYSGTSRADAYAEQARFKRLHKDIETYVSYDEPNYRVKVGDFRGRGEANNLMQSLRGQFNNVFIFTEEIYVYQ